MKSYTGLVMALLVVLMAPVSHGESNETEWVRQAKALGATIVDKLPEEICGNYYLLYAATDDKPWTDMTSFQVLVMKVSRSLFSIGTVYEDASRKKSVVKKVATRKNTKNQIVVNTLLDDNTIMTFVVEGLLPGNPVNQGKSRLPEMYASLMAASTLFI